MNTRSISALVCLLFCFSLNISAQQITTDQIVGMKWRMIGPFRAGRTVGAAGIPSQPNVFYIGVNNGGVWKTTDAGRTWKPIFDDQPTGSIGDLAIAPSNPNVIYVGSGEGLQRPDLSTGDGMYRSRDGGKTWTHLGLRDGQQIASIAVDPGNENRLFVAVLGHPYGPNAERGIYRSTDGGDTFERVLHIDENTGGFQVEFDPKNSQTVYADMRNRGRARRNHRTNVHISHTCGWGHNISPSNSKLFPLVSLFPNCNGLNASHPHSPQRNWSPFQRKFQALRYYMLSTGHHFAFQGFDLQGHVLNSPRNIFDRSGSRTLTDRHLCTGRIKDRY